MKNDTIDNTVRNNYHIVDNKAKAKHCCQGSNSKT